MKISHSLFEEYMGRQLSPNIRWVDDKKMVKNPLPIFLRGRWDLYQPWFGRGSWYLTQPWFERGSWYLSQPIFGRGGIAPEKAASDIELKRILQGTTIRKGSFMSYAMRGGYTLKYLAYGVHHRCVWLVELVEYTLDKYMGKDISHRTGLINI